MLLPLIWIACQGGGDSASPAPGDSPGESTPADSPPAAEPAPYGLWVTVTLDGAPVEGAAVLQGGLDARWLTDESGQALIEVDPRPEGDIIVMATHQDARIGGAFAPSAEDAPLGMTIELLRFSTADNTLYTFQDPGAPDIEDTTNQCSHCHITIVDAWYDSPHRTAASNPRVHDLYAGAAAAFASEAACAAAGGRWLEGIGPGTGAAGQRCYLGAGALPDLNPGCGDPCDAGATAFGACADCHAPGIDGQLGGRDLLEATGIAYEAGVHCDICHKVESVDLDAEPGVAGRLRIVRPSEEIQGVLGPWRPLTFGPYDDVLNPRMGSVPRELFHEATLCAGCHELEQAALVPGQSIDTGRWPEGRIPVHSTFSEWSAGPMADGVVCQSCHMPADGDVGNSADLGNELEEAVPGAAAGWYRPPGSVREHSWVGPRQRDSRMLELAAALTLELEEAEAGLLVRATVKNVGPGHAIPTGEPMRSLVLLVEASCGGEALRPIGGSVVPDYGGYADMKLAGEDWTIWPDAEPGDRLRVVSRAGWVDYSGYGPFGDGRFSTEEKGLPDERFAGEVSVLAVGDDGLVLTDSPLPEGDLVYRVRPGWPADGAPAQELAGAPGWAFARVLTDAAGARMAPHHRAVDVVSDNRLAPQASWTSEHLFEPGCAEPSARAVLVHRAAPPGLAAERGWALVDSVMVEVSR